MDIYLYHSLILNNIREKKSDHDALAIIFRDYAKFSLKITVLSAKLLMLYGNHRNFLDILCKYFKKQLNKIDEKTAKRYQR